MDTELYTHEGRGKGVFSMLSFYPGLLIAALGGYAWATAGPNVSVVASTVAGGLVVLISIARGLQPGLWRLRITPDELILDRPGKPSESRTLPCGDIQHLFVKARKRLIVVWATDRSILRIPPEVIDSTSRVVEALCKANPGIEVREI